MKKTYILIKKYVTAATLYRLRRQNPIDFCIFYVKIVFLPPGGLLGGSGGRSPPGKTVGRSGRVGSGLVQKYRRRKVFPNYFLNNNVFIRKQYSL